jgi:hypothetical protein
VFVLAPAAKARGAPSDAAAARPAAVIDKNLRRSGMKARQVAHMVFPF